MTKPLESQAPHSQSQTGVIGEIGTGGARAERLSWLLYQYLLAYTNLSPDGARARTHCFTTMAIPQIESTHRSPHRLALQNKSS